MDYQKVKSEYERLGYNKGWAFMMTPEALLTTAPTVLVGLNPGGDDDNAAWDSPDGNAYLHGRWRPDGRPTTMQSQVRQIMATLDLEEAELFAAQFIPFRSKRFGDLPRADEALAFSRRLWAWVLERSPARLFICMGKDAAGELANLLRAQPTDRFKAGWGDLYVERFVSPNGRVVVRLPHPSRFPIFSGDPQDVEIARGALRSAARLELER
ncbi:MAG TPA: uracil-DNA glycosylase family protein [Caulobacteraceae bacterium]|nr:uracil-DNA glycosylase family protein [Caulobacteraceae bacterium]